MATSAAAAVTVVEETLAPLPPSALEWVLDGSSTSAADPPRPRAAWCCACCEDPTTTTTSTSNNDNSDAGTPPPAPLVLALASGRRVLGLTSDDGAWGSRREHGARAGVTALLWIELDFGGDANWFLVLGDEDGCVCLLDRAFGVVYETRVHSSPVLSIRANNLTMGARKDATAQGLTVLCEDAVSLIHVEDLLRIYQNWKAKRYRSSADFARYDLSGAMGRAADAVAVGYAPSGLRGEVMAGEGGAGSDRRRVRVLVGGADPALVSLHLDKAAAITAASLLSLALDSTPIVGKIKQRLFRRKDEDLKQVAATAVPFVDPKRRIFSLALAPDYPLVACADSLGRVLVVDAANFVVTRVLKGYRDAETNWLYAPGDRALVLVVVAPRRKQVEVWDTFGGRKVKHFACRSGDYLAAQPYTLTAQPSPRAHGCEAAIKLALTEEGGLLLSRIALRRK